MKRKTMWCKIAAAALTFTAMSALTILPENAADTVMAAENNLAKADAEALVVVNSDDVSGNLTLPLIGENGSVITWESSDESIISSKADGSIAAGKVNRPAADTDVTLTATITNEDDVETKEIVCHVRKKVQVADTTDYLFSYFPYTGFKDERVYFGISEDGLNFDSLNNGKFVLESRQGTHGIRDPFVIRSHEGDKFYMIATDLTVAGVTQDGVKYPGMSWDKNQVQGSQSIVVWESDDLVNWSEERLVKVSVDNAGCTWAPEAYWDDETEQYVVFWASKTGDDNYSKQRLYFATTRDFHTFSEAQVWIEESGSVIDTTVIKVDDYYYRYTKNEAGNTNAYGTPSKRIYCERSKSLTSTDWELVSNNSLNISGGQIEGGCIFKINTDDVENAKDMAALKGYNLTADDIYCLAADRTGATIFPGLSDDITKGYFDVLGTGSNAQVDGITLYSMPDPVASHGTIMPITSEEYDRIMKAYDSTYAELAADYSELADLYLEDVEIKTKEDLSAVTKDIKLETEIDDGVTVAWTSSNENVISNTGVVTRPTFAEGDVVVELEATMTMQADEGVRDQIRRVTFQVTVLAEEKAPLAFTDVNESDWFYSAVEYNYYAGTMTGMDANTFNPNGNVVRGQFASIIHRLAGEEKVEFTPEFPDVLESDWYAEPVLWAKANKIVSGYNDGTFGPGNNIVREQIAIILHNYAAAAGYDVSAAADLSVFGDAELVDDYAVPAMQWAVESGIISGTKEGNLKPLENASRAECAAMIMNFMENCMK